jgi:hypothetical protein
LLGGKRKRHSPRVTGLDANNKSTTPFDSTQGACHVIFVFRDAKQP